MSEEKTVYEKFADAVQGTRQRVNDLNNEINENRAQYAKYLADFDTATMAGDEAVATKAREQCEKLDRDLLWKQRTIALISDDGVKSDPVVKRAGQAVLDANRGHMDEIQAEWDHVANNLAETRAVVVDLVARLGQIQKRAARVRTQTEHVLQTVGGNQVWLAAPGDRVVNTIRQTGLIYFDPKEMTKIYQNGKV